MIILYSEAYVIFSWIKIINEEITKQNEDNEFIPLSPSISFSYQIRDDFILIAIHQNDLNNEQQRLRVRIIL